ncbi:MAG: DUF4416 family protein [Anaerolineae bacterium]
MGRAKEPLPVKLIASLFSAEEELIEKAKEAMVEHFGPADYESELLPFDHTDYYAPEFGEGLVRRFLAFAKLVDPRELAGIKIWTNELEMKFAEGEKRRVNIDPGYVSQSKLVLATTKDHSHRIYLGQGIYAEVTLRFYKGSFRPWEWTYPDYASPAYISIFNRIREAYRKQLKHKEELTCKE